MWLVGIFLFLALVFIFLGFHTKKNRKVSQYDREAAFLFLTLLQ